METKLSPDAITESVKDRMTHYQSLLRMKELQDLNPLPLHKQTLKEQFMFWKELQKSYHIWSDFQDLLTTHWQEETKIIDIYTNLYYIYDFGDGETSTRQLRFTAIAAKSLGNPYNPAGFEIDYCKNLLLSKKIVFVEAAFPNARFDILWHGKELSSKEIRQTLSTVPCINFHGGTRPEDFVFYATQFPAVFHTFFKNLDLGDLPAEIGANAKAIQQMAREELNKLSKDKKKLNESITTVKKALDITKQK